MPTKDNVSRLADLAQKWMYGSLTDDERFELNSWYSALEDKQLGNPDGMVLERIEQRLNEMVMKQVKPEPLPDSFDIGKMLKGDN